MAPLFQQPFMSGGFPSMNRVGGAVGGWVELGRTTLGGTSDTITVSGLTSKRYYMVLNNTISSGGNNTADLRVGNGSVDTASNYAYRASLDGGADFTSTNQNFILMGSDGLNTPKFGVSYIANYATKEKLHLGHLVYQNTAGAGNAPSRSENVNKWAITDAEIDVIQGYNRGTGDYASGSEVVVLGYDPADSHTNNFWEELGSHELSSQSNELDVSGMTAKKYLWYQAFIKKNSTASNYTEHSINGITTGNTWARRISSNGGADGTNTSQNTMNTTDTGAGGYFLNGFVINNSGQEKLFIEHVIQNTTAGAGTAPSRKEVVMKSTTTAQITQLTITGATNGYEAGSILKVWGAD